MHDEIHVERTEDGAVVPPDDFGLVLDDPVGSSKDSGPYTDDDTGLDDTGTSENPEVTAEETAVAQPDA